MPEKWTAEVIGLLHLHRITRAELAEKLGFSKAYLTMVLKGYRTPAGAEARCRAALDELIKERENES